MGKYGDGKLKENELYVDDATKQMIQGIQDPKLQRQVHKQLMEN